MAASSTSSLEINYYPQDEDTIMIYESEYLRSKVLFDPKIRRLMQSESEIKLASRRHECSNGTCILESLNPGESFFGVDGHRYNASGEVYVCQQYCKIHICGRSCDYAKYDAQGLVCTLTGVFITGGVSLARSGLDPNILMFGTNVVGETFDPEDEDARGDGLTEHQHERMIGSQFAMMTTTEGIDSYDFLDEGDHVHHLISDVQYQENEISSKEEERLLNYAKNNEQDVSRILSLYTGASESILKSKIEERVSRRKRIKEIWNTLVASKRHVEGVRLRAEKAHKHFLKAWHDYYAACYKQKICPSRTQVLFLFIKILDPIYKNYYCGDDIDKLNRKERVLFTECILRLWEKYEQLPLVKSGRVKFEQCCSAILRSLSTGLEENVYVVKGNPKPRYWGDLTTEEKRTAKEYLIIFIDKHEDFILAEPQEVRDYHPSLKLSATSSSSPRPRRKDTGMSNFVSSKRGLGTRQRGSGNRRNAVRLQVMPPLKILKSLIVEAIEISNSIEELATFRLTDIYPRTKLK